MLLTAISRPVSLHNHRKRLVGTTFSLLQERCSGVSEWPHSGPLGRTQRYAGQSLPTSCRAQQLKATVSSKSRILATPGVLSVSYKVPDISKRSTGMSRVGLAARYWDLHCLLVQLPLGISSLCSRQHQRNWHLLTQRTAQTSLSALAKPGSPGPGLQRAQPHREMQHLHTQISHQLLLFS